jgi:predicted RNA-binding Zn ribbon-like protein
MTPSPRELLTAQPGGRAPAPGGLALVQSFMNTFFDLGPDRGADLLATPEGAGAWLARTGLVLQLAELPTPDELRRAARLREALRTLAGRTSADTTQDRLDALVDGALVEVRLTGDGPRFVPAAADGLDYVLALVMGNAAIAMIDGTWSRLKICPGEHCGWTFYDHSRNQSSRWCSMAVCGGRAKARAHYRRSRGQD